MSQRAEGGFAKQVTYFRESRLPEPGVLVGYAALIDAHGLNVPLPAMLCAIGARHKIYEQNGWKIYSPRYQPPSTLEGQLVFALKYEGLDLAVLKRLFMALDPDDITTIIKTKPTSSYMRRIWFLYEWLLDRRLEIEDARSGNYVDVVDRKQQWAVAGTTSTRHRVWNNLPGSRDFCPLVRCSDKLNRFVGFDLSKQAQEVIARVSASVLARTAAFLLLKDSRSSYAIEGETPPQSRIQRWGRVIGEAGRHPLDEDEFLRLQQIVIGGDNRFVSLGLRDEGGFIGEHEMDTRQPLPEHVSARHQDLRDLMRGLTVFDRDYAGGLDPVIAAAMLAFGFVYIHPFEDGNGRIHRYLIHHVLAARGFNPPGVVFPVSAVILDRVEDYRAVLQSYSARLLPVVEWLPTPRMNVDVQNDTGDFYRYFDATPHAEFLYECVQRTIEHDLPTETQFLMAYDMFKTRVEVIVEMPALMLDLLFGFLKQNNGQLSKRALSREFRDLHQNEVVAIEDIYRDLFLLQAD